MKRLFLVLGTISMLLCGCQGDTAKDKIDYADEISKAHEIAVIEDDTVVEKIIGEKATEAFVIALDLDKWTWEKLPKDAKPVGTFQLSQDGPVKLGQKDADEIVQGPCKIVLYDCPYVELEVSGKFSMTFAISQETEAYLRGYFK